MDETRQQELLLAFRDGRTDVIFDLVAGGMAADAVDEGNPLIRTCAYYGDVSAIRYLLGRGAPLAGLGPNLELSTAAFHGHWQLCQFLLERGAQVNEAEAGSLETPLHAAVSQGDRQLHDRVVDVLLAYGADPNLATATGFETQAFMRDCRTKGETALHRAAAFGGAVTLELLLKAGARVDVRDAFGDTPLSWASWYGRPVEILRPLLYDGFRINAKNQPMRVNLIGRPR